MTRPPLVHEVFVGCDPSTAFDLLAEVRNESRWSSGVTVAELRSDGPVGQGSKFLTVFRGVQSDVVISDYHRPERLVIAAINDSMDIDTTYTFREANGGTELKVVTDVSLKGLMSVLSPLIRLFMRREVARKYETFKRIVEAQPSPPSGRAREETN